MLKQFYSPFINLTKHKNVVYLIFISYTLNLFPGSLSQQPLSLIPTSGLSKSFRKMAENVQLRVKKTGSGEDDNTIKVAGTNQRLSVRLNREPSRRSQYLARFLRRRPTHDELKAQGIIKVMVT